MQGISNESVRHINRLIIFSPANRLNAA